ncbi:MAG: IMP cyclohydrolase [Desulfovibrio sp.]|jgi:phosphoribosylaminoimidazolecarboxamide formyltransferase/IMP cyclohydrolase|nr:IMP cyclohydrolase [Desulfovibrio sp.]
MERIPIKRAVLSVTDKSGLTGFAAFLAQGGVELVSTGGTAAALRQAGLPVTQVDALTGFPEILDGRVKTLHPGIYGGILADKDNPGHLRSLRGHGIGLIDLVCVNLYNFAQAVGWETPPAPDGGECSAQPLPGCGGQRPAPSLRDAVEEIDIGGPCMLRAAAKNFNSVLAVDSPSLYPEVMRVLADNGMCAPLDLRLRCATAVFAGTAAYDRMIAEYLGTRAP